MNSQRRRLSSTAPVPERPPTKSSKAGMQNVFWTSTATRQIRNASSTAGCELVLLRPFLGVVSQLLVLARARPRPRVAGSKCAGTGSTAPSLVTAPRGTAG